MYCLDRGPRLNLGPTLPQGFARFNKCIDRKNGLATREPDYAIETTVSVLTLFYGSLRLAREILFQVPYRHPQETRLGSLRSSGQVG